MTYEEERRAFLQRAVAVAGTLATATFADALMSGAYAADVAPTSAQAMSKQVASTQSASNQPTSLPAALAELPTSAVEDLMREHGVLRRVVLIYRTCAQRLRVEPAGSLALEPLHKAAQLMRSYGENYHERKLEEAFIFPVLRKLPGPIAVYPTTLLVQHTRGREITDYILAATQPGRVGAPHPEALTRALETFALMYDEHTVREDTVVFPAWKAALGAGRLAEMAGKFAEVEHAEFGAHGFGDAVTTVADIEHSLSISDLAEFTAPPPPQQS